MSLFRGLPITTEYHFFSFNFLVLNNNRIQKYCGLPITQTFRENRKRFELSEVRVIEGGIIKWAKRKRKVLRVAWRFDVATVRVIGSQLHSVSLNQMLNSSKPAESGLRIF